MNGSLKLDNTSCLKRRESCLKAPQSTELLMSNGRSISSQNMVVENGHQSSSVETLEDTTSYLYRSANRISVSRRENKILADERDMRKELHQMVNSCDEEDYLNDGPVDTELVLYNGRKTSEGNKKVFARQGSVQTWGPNEKQFQKTRTQSFHYEKKNATVV